jgi:hypothetical protein
MFAHVTVGALEIELSRKFYDATFVELGIKPGVTEDRWLVYNSGNCVFAVGLPFDGNPARCANGVTIGLTASRKNVVDAWHTAGLRNGGSCEGEPGVRNEGRSYVPTCAIPWEINSVPNLILKVAFSQPGTRKGGATPTLKGEGGKIRVWPRPQDWTNRGTGT